MRILQVHTRYRQAGGEDAVVEAERSALEAAGHEVVQHIEENPARPVGAAVSLAGSLWNPRSARRIGREVAAIRPDVAHVHNTWFASSPSVFAALKRRGVPVVMTVHNYRLACVNGLFLRDGAPCEKCLEHGPWPAVQHSCYRGSRATSAVAAAGIAVHSGLGTWGRLVDRFIVLSDFARSRLIRAGLPPIRLVVGSNFVADPGRRGVAPSESRNVLFVGRLAGEKGIHVLLDAWRAVSSSGLRLDIIGAGPGARACSAGAPGTTGCHLSRPSSSRRGDGSFAGGEGFGHPVHLVRGTTGGRARRPRGWNAAGPLRHRWAAGGAAWTRCRVALCTKPDRRVDASPRGAEQRHSSRSAWRSCPWALPGRLHPGSAWEQLPLVPF